MAAALFLAALCVPLLGSRFYTFLATDIAILALFAVSLNLLVGTTGLISFGHAAYFGIGAYTCAILMKSHGVPFVFAFLAAGGTAAAFAALFGFFCVRSTPDLLRDADPGLRADRLGRLLQVELGDGRRAGPVERSLSRPHLAAQASRLGQLSVGEQFYLLVLVLVAALPGAAAPDRPLAVRPHPRRDPREPGACRVRGRERAPLPARGLRQSPGCSPAWPVRCSGCSIAASSRTSPTGPSRPRS